MNAKPLSIGYNTQIDSDAINRWSDAVIADLIALKQQQDQVLADTETALLLQGYEDLFAARHREELSQEFRLLRRELQSLQLSQGSAVSVDLPVTDAVVAEGHQLSIYGALLPAMTNVVDRLMGDEVPQITVYPAPDGAAVKDTALHAVVDHRYDTVWLRTVETALDSSTTYVEAQLEIALPKQAPTDRLNLIGLLPYPSWGMTVVGIDVLTEQGTWQRVQDTVTAAGPLLTVFTPLYSSRIRLHLRQDHALLFGDRKVFVFGIRDLTVLSVLFGDAISFQVTATLPQAGMWLKSVTTDPVMADARVHVRAMESDILPVYVSGRQLTLEVTVEGEALQPLRGLTLKLAR